METTKGKKLNSVPLPSSYVEASVSQKIRPLKR
jgi:hypothetical protein